MEQLDFKKAVENLRHTGFSPIPDRVLVSIPDARGHLERGLAYFVGERYTWLPEYEKVAQWLSNNNGKGLLCFGNCGRGKSVICGKIIPLLLNHYHHKVVSCYDAQTMNNDIDDVKRKHIIYIDDIGIENVSIKFGEKRLAFPEIVDEAEKKGKLLIITTNLSLAEIEQKYGERTKDRLIAIVDNVLFKGKSLRH
jgi:DNA replication protein DnaC